MLKSSDALKVRSVAIFFFMSLMWGLILFLAVDGYGQEILVHRDSLLSKAAEEGHVRVIVAFQVPELEKLQEVSRRSGTQPIGVKGSSSAVARAREADRVLAGTISRSASSIFKGLGLEKKVNHIFKTVPQAVITADSKDLLALEGSPQVLRVTEDAATPVPVLAPSKDTRNSSGGGSYGVQIINAPEAWKRGYDGKGYYLE